MKVRVYPWALVDPRKLTRDDPTREVIVDGRGFVKEIIYESGRDPLRGVLEAIA